ncbi:Uma2 family endonuclease [Stratiformator vulcanicus]|uniref:Putative restriction endonuclease domain-containing protein n=1 Tax=Stratiformator vulcanicus TaxID=2527980 RepID=A0A517R5B0_9PLAN|nr:Uma2 family endonuclease [Stratiformator vulcanicus]QDT39078.1 hypothetical protein Pan189_34800 [Stratiformator vulcanicus]
MPASAKLETSTSSAPPDDGSRAVRFTVEQYQRMIDAGVFDSDRRVELLRGRIVRMPAMQNPHWFLLHHVEKLINGLLPSGYFTSEQAPIVFDDSEPEPDVGVIRGLLTDYRESKPRASDAAMLIEIASRSLLSDRRDKGPIYASGSVPEYWIVNAIDRSVEVYRDPKASVSAIAADYQQRTTYRDSDPIPFQLDGKDIATIRCDELIPLAD